MTLAIEIPDVATLPATGRFRLPGGRVTHRAAIVRGDDGFHAIRFCDPTIIHWLAWSEDERLALIQPDDAEVTCKGCQRLEERVTPEPTP